MTRHRIGTISDEAVEAAARVFYHLQPNGTPLIREREQARAALEAALPHLLDGKMSLSELVAASREVEAATDHMVFDGHALDAFDRLGDALRPFAEVASQGCGTGHSGKQLEPAVGATAALAIEDGVPLGYSVLPAGARCRCLKLWISASGRHYCCKPLAHPQKGGEG
ncbi:hypothetical protein J2X45_001011 [Caulobacter sp. BE264]|uniref:hypothetical protein n=1 Tax=Caulobacter sp. BE264 TaxID=2817724 RepID=UPI00285E7BA2|nr:hypothetical protein [Caulobacter sp. BE264]MDR7229930.1 hypothetical protein [Caulobacter sp. BE264]